METRWDIGQLLGVSTAYWKGCALQAAVRLGLFDSLGASGSTPEQVAAAGTDIRATSLLLDALTGIGLVVKRDERYANSSFSAKFLVEESPAYMGHIILHHHNILDGWAQLDQAVKTGRKVTRRSYGEERERENFLMGMFNLASGLAPQIAQRFPLDGRKHLLDLGGGPGTYAIHFCLENPGLKATIFDRPTTEPFARETVAKYELSERINFIGGDFNEDTFPQGPYDVIWMSHILHSNRYDECEGLVANAVEVLADDGVLMIHDFILSDEKDGPEFATLFSLNMLVGTEGGRAYSIKEISELLEKGGLKDLEHHPLDVPNESSILLGAKK